MRHRSRPFAALGLAAASLALLTGQAAPQGITVTVKVTDIRNSKGVVRACMTTDAKRFPRCQGSENAHRAVVDAGPSVTFAFKGVRPGKYAIAMLHDENNNGKADRVLGMAPKEGYGFSRDAPVRMAPPKFAEAAFDIGSEPLSQTIKMRYWL
jgi:uncharacterized protein (DUF2141 family)